MNQTVDVKDVLVEIGRMHLQVTSLEQQLNEARARISELTPKAPAIPPNQ